MSLKVPDSCDVVIAGGGLVGSALAVALAELPLKTLMIEPRDPAALEQPSFDARVTALANGSVRILDGLGLWPAMAGDVEAITDIQISEQGALGATRIAAHREGVTALGYTVENRVLGAALWGRLAIAPSFELATPAVLAGFDVRDDAVVAHVETGGGRVDVRARVLIAADGVESSVRSALAIPAARDDYGQTAIVVNCEIERRLHGLALERFTPDGPLAVLPLPQGRAGLVWTMPSARAAQVIGDSDAKFCAALDRALGGRLGAVMRLGHRGAYPLRRVRSARVVAARTALVGNAAVNLHPVAGQGFNLALRDVATLAELFADSLAAGDPDIGRTQVLEAYARWRRRDQAAVAGFTHGLVRLFGLRGPGLAVARGLALAAFDLMPGAKSALARHTMGRAGRLPRLACGRFLQE